MRNAGHWLTWNQKPREFTGTLLTGRASKDDDASIVSLYLSEGPRLFDPRIKSVFDREMRIVGLEKHESAWVLQEWNCEILGGG